MNNMVVVYKYINEDTSRISTAKRKAYQYCMINCVELAINKLFWESLSILNDQSQPQLNGTYSYALHIFFNELKDIFSLINF